MPIYVRGPARAVHVVDMADPSRVERGPDQSVRIAGGVRYALRGLSVTGLELRLYRGGGAPLITAVLYADEGSAECVYDEGPRGPDPLGNAARFVKETGAAAIVERLSIALADALDI